MYGTIPMDATPGTYDPIAVQQNQSPITPLPGGTESTIERGNAFGNIRIAAPFINRLDLRPISQNFRHSSIPTAAGLDFLSGFLFRNEFADELYEQAIRIFFDDPAIGVQAMRLPVGTQGLGYLRAYTNLGNVITLPHADVAITAPTTFLANRPNQTVNINFLGALQPSEFITEIYYELAGIVQEGFSNVESQLNSRTATDFFFLGQLLDHSVSSFSIRAIAGQRCATSPDGIVQNPPEIADNSPYSLRSLVTDVRPIENRGLAYERFQVFTNSTGLDATFVGGADWSRRSFGFSSSSAEWRGTNTHVTALKGHYIYLRAPLNVFEINQDTIAVRWGGNTWTDGNGITVTPIVDSTGSQAFRIAIPHAISGHSQADFAIAGTGLRNYSAINVDFDIRAVPWAATQNIPANQIIMMVPMYDGVRPHGVDTNRQVFNPNFTIDCGTRPPRIREIGANREVFGSTRVVNIIESASLITTVATRSIGANGNILDYATAHNWAGAGILNMVPGSTIQQELRYFNPTNDNVGQFHAFIPIPREGYMLPLEQIPEADLRAEVQREPFEFTLELTGPVETIPGFRIYYSTDYTFNPFHPNLVSEGDVVDWSQVRMVFIQSYRNIAPQEVGYFTLNLALPAGADTQDMAGMINAYAPLTFSSVLGNAARRRSTPAAMRLWNYVVFNYNYTGSDGVFEYVPVAGGGTVAAPTTPPTRTNYTFAGWFTTSAGGTEFDFDAAVATGVTQVYAGWTRNQRTITYTVTGVAPAVVNGMPTSPQTVYAGDPATVEAVPTTTSTTNALGVVGSWSFNGWNHATITGPSFTMPDGNVEFTGSWVFTAGTSSVIYNVSGAVPPVVNGMPASPQNATNGATVTVAAVPTTPSTTNAAGVAGVWTFSGWSHPTITGPTFVMPNSNVEFAGSWAFEVARFDINYQFTGDVPAGAILPATRSVDAGTANVSPTSIDPTTINDATGTWTFGGWTTTSTGANPTTPFTMPNNDVNFVGNWTFVATTFDITYEFTGEVPAAAALPAARNIATNTANITPTSVVPATITTPAGTWTFGGWTTTSTGASATAPFAMPSNDVHFVGNWTFVAATFDITYQFTGNVPTGATLPATRNIDAGTANVSATPISPTTISDETGTWAFGGWATTSAGASGTTPFNMPSNNVHFVGNWTFTPSQGGGEPSYNLVISKAANPAHNSHVAVGQVVTYTITVRNNGDDASGQVTIVDTIPAGMTLVEGSATTTINGAASTSITPAIAGSTLTWSVPSIAQGSIVAVSFQVTVDPLPAGEYNRIFRNTAIVNGETTNRVDLFTQGLVKNPDRMVVSVGDTINWTLRGFHNPRDVAVTNFAIIDMPSAGLNFTSASLPAFTNAAGVTFDVRYRVNNGSWQTHAENVPANAPFTFSLPQPGNLHYTHIGLFFGDVPVGFGLGDEMVFSFIVSADAPDNVLINNFLRMYNDRENEGISPDRPIITTPGGGGQGTPTTPPTSVIPFNPIHHAYLIGDVNCFIRPNDSITRAEVATILFRLVSDEYRAQVWTQDNPFSDVELNQWFNNAISTMANAGVLLGMPDGSFEPNRPITRAEFAAMMTRFFTDFPEIGAYAFPDIYGHWAAREINIAAGAGWIQGFPNGTFAPNQAITRAEVAAIINRILLRRPETADDLLPGMITWPDNMDVNAWFYLYIQEATNSNYFEMHANGVHKRWIELIDPRDWTVLERPNSQPGDIAR